MKRTLHLKINESSLLILMHDHQLTIYQAVLQIVILSTKLPIPIGVYNIYIYLTYKKCIHVMKLFQCIEQIKIYCYKCTVLRSRSTLGALRSSYIIRRMEKFISLICYYRNKFVFIVLVNSLCLNKQ